jgi:hypothetical protein
MLHEFFCPAVPKAIHSNFISGMIPSKYEFWLLESYKSGSDRLIAMKFNNM